MNRRRIHGWPLLLASMAVLVAACAGGPDPGVSTPTVEEILLTSEAGHKIASMDGPDFRPGPASGTVITVDPDDVRQIIDGIGSSFTESSAFVLAWAGASAWDVSVYIADAPYQRLALIGGQRFACVEGL